MYFQHNSLVVYVLCDIHSTCTHTAAYYVLLYEQQLGRPTYSRVGLELHERSYRTKEHTHHHHHHHCASAIQTQWILFWKRV